MSNSDLILNIAVNLGRLGKWSLEKRTARIEQFLQDSENYLKQINPKTLNKQFQSTFSRFVDDFKHLQTNSSENIEWADTAFTWASILAHRAKLA